MTKQKKVTKKQSSVKSKSSNLNKNKCGVQTVERVKTGIYGLDELTQGGFVKGSTVLVSGGCGAGKTLFASQFLYNGAKFYNEPGVYLSLEETPKEIRADMQSIGLDPEPLEKEGKLIITYKNPTKFIDAGDVVESNITQVIKDLVNKIDAKRIAIDSTGAFELYFKHAYEIRQKTYEVVQALKDLDVTSILTSEVLEKRRGYSRSEVEEFVADAVIVLDYMEFVSGGAIRSLFIRKMRRTSQGRDIYTFEIVPGKGIVITPVEERFHKYLLSKYKSELR